MAGSILDVGSGTGDFLKEMRSNGWQVTGLEPDKTARSIARKKNDLELGEEKVLFNLPLNSFDVVSLWHVLEHVHDLHRYLGQIKSLLKDRGIILIAVPNYTSKDAMTFKEYWAAYDVPRHLYHFSPLSMRILMDKYGLRIKKTKAMWYDSIYISLLSSRYKTGKPDYISSAVHGLSSNLRAVMNKEKSSSVIYIITR